MTDFAQRLRALRLARGFTSHAMLAAATDGKLTPQMIGRYELGKGLPGYKALTVLARALGVSASELMGEE